jgi:hypothetical protein
VRMEEGQGLLAEKDRAPVAKTLHRALTHSRALDTSHSLRPYKDTPFRLGSHPCAFVDRVGYDPPAAGFFRVQPYP